MQASTLFLYVDGVKSANRAEIFGQNDAKVILLSVLFAKKQKRRVQTVENQV